MRPIIEYQGPLFQWLCRLVTWLGYDNALALWKTGLIGWLLLLGGLFVVKQSKNVFTGVLLAGILLLRLPGLGLTEQNVDEGQWIVSAATLVYDPRFWRSVDGTTSGPFNVWPPALLYYLGLGLDYTTLRLWGLLTCVLPTSWLLLATFRREFGERVARLAILPVAMCLALTTDPDGVAFNSEQLPMMLLALSGYLFSLIFTEKTLTHRRTLIGLLMLGVVLGCLPYTKLQATPIGLVMAGWALMELYRGRIGVTSHKWQRITVFVLAGLLPTFLVGIYLLSTDLTDYAFKSYILTNLEYAQDGSWGAGTVTWTDRLLVRLPQIYCHMRTTNSFWRLALALSILALVRLVVWPAKRNWATNKLWFVVSVCATGFYVTLQPGNPFAHYQWLSFVPVSWLIAELIYRLMDGLKTLPRMDRVWKWSLGISYVLAGLVYPVWLALSRPSVSIEQLAIGRWNSSTKPVSEAIRHYAGPNEKMVIWGWANNLHVETGLLMGSRFIPLYFPVVPGPQQAYFLDVYRQDLLTNRPTIIVDATAMHYGKGYERYPIRRYPLIQTILDRHYQLRQIVGGAKIYALRK